MNKYDVSYRVLDGGIHDRLKDARHEAESIMAGRHDDDSVLIERKEAGEDFYEPYASIHREHGQFVLKR